MFVITWKGGDGVLSSRLWFRWNFPLFRQWWAIIGPHDISCTVWPSHQFISRHRTFVPCSSTRHAAQVSRHQFIERKLNFCRYGYEDPFPLSSRTQLKIVAQVVVSCGQVHCQGEYHCAASALPFLRNARRKLVIGEGKFSRNLVNSITLRDVIKKFICCRYNEYSAWFTTCVAKRLVGTVRIMRQRVSRIYVNLTAGRVLTFDCTYVLRVTYWICRVILVNTKLRRKSAYSITITWKEINQLLYPEHVIRHEWSLNGFT